MVQALNVEVSTFGTSLEEAKEAIQGTLELYFEDQPIDVPEIASATLGSVHVRVA